MMKDEMNKTWVLIRKTNKKKKINQFHNPNTNIDGPLDYADNLISSNFWWQLSGSFAWRVHIWLAKTFSMCQ